MCGKAETGNIVSDEVILKKGFLEVEILQEIIIRKNGSVEIPWITPKASGLVLSLWEDLHKNRQPFVVQKLYGNIYCG